jgi:hypothetical protein
MLVLPEARQQRDDNVADRSRGQDEGQISPGQGREIGREEADEQRDSDENFRCLEGVEERGKVSE